MATECTPLCGARARAARRHVAFSVVAGKLQAAYARIKQLEAMLAGQVASSGECIASNGLDEELLARLSAIVPCLEEQKKFGARSPSGLVSPQVQLLANAAKHNFVSDFRTLTTREARRQQRGGAPTLEEQQHIASTIAAEQQVPVPPPPTPVEIIHIDFEQCLLKMHADVRDEAFVEVKEEPCTFSRHA